MLALLPQIVSSTDSNSGPANAAKSPMRNGKAGASTRTALHPIVLDRLPDYIKLQLPITFSRHGAIDRSVLDTLTHSILHGGSFTVAAAGIADACKRREQRHQQLYMQYQLAQQKSGRQALLPALLQQTQAGDSQAANSSKHLQVSTSFQPSRQWLSVVWLEAMRPNIDWAGRYMSTVKSRFWCMDHTFATAKCIRDAEQQLVYKAVLTIVNEHSQLVAQWFTHTTSLCEVRGCGCYGISTRSRMLSIIIPAPQEIVPSLNALVEKNGVDESSVSLLTDTTSQAHSAALHIIQNGRLSGKLLCKPAVTLPNACHTCSGAAYYLLRPL